MRNRLLKFLTKLVYSSALNFTFRFIWCNWFINHASCDDFHKGDNQLLKFTYRQRAVASTKVPGLWRPPHLLITPSFPCAQHPDTHTTTFISASAYSWSRGEIKGTWQYAHARTWQRLVINICKFIENICGWNWSGCVSLHAAACYLASAFL